MLYLLAIICPPLAVLFTGRIFQAALNLLLTFLGVIPGMIHAVLVVNDYKADKRMERQVRMMRE
ncbi:YqaE/Pmp3 family membrane protein [Brevibacillus laterosporus]|nr:YqaE/Pmp3 family membrane protein [Brevibacillus laterosporus]TPG84192.1 YqaE/Pmp3 family membrane protein [Brevibacillus laterosporus]